MQTSKIELGENSLVANEVIPRQDTHYLVTKQELKSLRDRGFMTEIFLFFASLASGVFISTWLTLESSDKLPPETVSTLFVYKNVSLLVGAIFFGFTVFLFLRSKNQIEGIEQEDEVDDRNETSHPKKAS